jgi:hydroxyacylglutathione hydrolase
MLVRVVPVMKDNFSYVIRCNRTNSFGVVDVSDTRPVEESLAELSAPLTADNVAILTTHRHRDHCGGNGTLAQKIPGVKVYGSAMEPPGSIPALNHPLRDGDEFSIGTLRIRVLFTPCHTAGHVLFHVCAPEEPDAGALFTGDTIFTAGLGAFFEGNASQMVHAMRRVHNELPPSTLVFPGHEYTEGFLKFSNTIDPAADGLRAVCARVAERRAADLPSVPTSLAEEMQINTFYQAANGHRRLFDQLREAGVEGITTGEKESERIVAMEYLYNKCD